MVGGICTIHHLEGTIGKMPEKHRQILEYSGVELHGLSIDVSHVELRLVQNSLASPKQMGLNFQVQLFFILCIYGHHVHFCYCS